MNIFSITFALFIHKMSFLFQEDLIVVSNKAQSFNKFEQFLVSTNETIKEKTSQLESILQHLEK